MSELIKQLGYALVVIVLTTIFYRFNTKQQLSFPIVNSYCGDRDQKKAHQQYQANAKELIANGIKDHGSPIVIKTPQGTKLILPSSLTEWVKNNKDLDHVEHVKEDYFSGYPGFDGQTALHHPSHILTTVIKSKLSKNDGAVPVLNAHIVEALGQRWTESEAWHAIDWHQDTTSIVSTAAASIFVGPRLAKNQEWVDLTVTYVLDFFTAIGQLHQWPASLRPIAQRFNALSNRCRSNMKRARIIMQEENVKRNADRANSHVDYNDAFEWITKAAGGRPVDMAAQQLGLGVAALFTTSEALRQTILEIAAHPDLISSLREEIEQAVLESGWTMAALFKMKLLDSVMKEGQRTLPPIVSLERKALRDTIMPDGGKVPKGTHIAVDSSLMWDENIYNSAKTFKGHRYLELRDSGASSQVFTASSKEHTSFGLGRSICPGRFFADTELKLCLAHMLLNYDLRLQEGYKPKPMYSGFYGMVDPFAKIEVRRVHK
ncbi:putative cytochrome P450 [Aureobasidium namibiae CBS 147.97]|uniref:Putative cytochrome P450 n=1 Tax=Aureobasidium namibiae CBS 147.97 TaxID=1043004 RepID=A0A074XP59_9PEZI